MPPLQVALDEGGDRNLKVHLILSQVIGEEMKLKWFHVKPAEGEKMDYTHYEAE